MKKTLITLAALAASVASAADYTASYTQDDFSSNVLTLQHGLYFGQDWTLTVDVTVGTAAYNEWGSGVLASGSSFTENSYSNGFQVWHAINDGTTLTKLNGSTETKLETPWSAGETYTFNVSYVAETGVIRVTGAGFDASSTLTNAKELATITQLSSGVIGLEGWSVAITQTASIPEPATATLSLLALAGLAARRRRK